MSNSEIICHPHGTTFSGPDAVDLYRAISLRAALTLWTKTKMIPTRGLTITKMLALCTSYTGKTYKRTQVPQAIADLQVWIATMQSAIPVSSGEAGPIA